MVEEEQFSDVLSELAREHFLPRAVQLSRPVVGSWKH